MKVSTAASTATLFLSTLLVADAFSGSPWWKNETDDTFVNWPTEVASILEEESETFHEDNFPGLPVLRAFETFPEFEPRIWPLIKGMSWRLHPVLWPRMHYYMVSGLDFGCRTLDEDTGNEVPVMTAHCHRHCIHEGRYCAPQKFEVDVDGPQGHDALKEILHRLCLDEIYHAKDKRVISYLEEFDANNCWAQEHIRNCSITAISTVGAHWSEIEECVAEDTWDDDVPNNVLDRNMRHIVQKNLTLHEMPTVLIDGKAIPAGQDGYIDTNSIWSAYCQAFPAHFERPFACDVCEGCADVRTCLWTLTCDGEPFDMAVFLDDGQSQLPATNPPKDNTPPAIGNGAPEEETTDAPANSDTTESKATSDSDSDASEEDDSGSSGHGFFLFGMFIIAAILCCPLACFIYKEKRTKQLMAEIKAGKYTSEFRDEQAFKDSNMELGGRQKEMDPEAEPYVDVVMDDEIKVEDMMDDESEESQWAEDKRSGLPEIS